MEVIGEVRKHPNARVFSFGIGSSVNRFLLDKMAEAGRGEVEYVALTDDGSAAARRFHERIRNPLMTDIEVDWSGLPVADVYPKRLPDLFSAKPLILTGRYTAGARGIVRLKGRLAGREFTREIPVELPEAQPQHDVLATLWARTRIDDLMSQDYQGIQNGNPQTDVREAITQLGLEYRLMTQFTSFVAVEETIVTDGGQPRRIDVPVEMPEGVSHEGVFGRREEGKEVSRTKLNQGAVMHSQVAIGGPQRVPADSAAVNAPAPPPPSMTPGTLGRMSPAKPTASSGGGGKNEVNKRNEKVRGMPDSRPPLLESQGDQQLLSKLHPSIAAVVERLKSKIATPGVDEAKFVSNGKAEVQIWLTDKSPATIEQLKKLGFEVILNSPSSKVLIGRAPIEKLAAIAELKFVRFVAPQTN